LLEKEVIDTDVANNKVPEFFRDLNADKAAAKITTLLLQTLGLTVFYLWIASRS